MIGPWSQDESLLITIEVDDKEPLYRTTLLHGGPFRIEERPVGAEQHIGIGSGYTHAVEERDHRTGEFQIGGVERLGEYGPVSPDVDDVPCGRVPGPHHLLQGNLPRQVVEVHDVQVGVVCKARPSSGAADHQRPTGTGKPACPRWHNLFFLRPEHDPERFAVFRDPRDPSHPLQVALVLSLVEDASVVEPCQRRHTARIGVLGQRHRSPTNQGPLQDICPYLVRNPLTVRRVYDFPRLLRPGDRRDLSRAPHLEPKLGIGRAGADRENHARSVRGERREASDGCL